MDQVALYLDFENLVIGAAGLPGDNPVPYKALELLCRDYGNAAIRRAYADWTRPQYGCRQHDLALNGIEMIQVTRFGVQQKNAADILLTADAMEALFTRPEVGTYILVAGDGDYTPLVQRLRSFGKKVVGVGTEASASSRLVAVCSEYKYWGTLVGAVDPAVRAEVGAKFDIADAERLVIAALEESPDASATGAWLKSKMLALDPSFDEHNYGRKTFREFLKLLPGVVSVEQKASADMRVSLIPNPSGAKRPASGK